MHDIKNVIGAALVGGPGTGKDSTAERLVKLLEPVGGNGWAYYSIGDACRHVAAKHDGMSIEDFNKKRDEDPSFCPSFDRDVDKTSLDYCHDSVFSGKPFVITSRMVPALLHLGLIRTVGSPEKIIRILFTCENDKERITRIVKREFKKEYQRMPTEREIYVRFAEATERTLAREAEDAERYKKLYGIEDIYHPSYFGTNIIDTKGMSPDAQVEATRQLIAAHL